MSETICHSVSGMVPVSISSLGSSNLLSGNCRRQVLDFGDFRRSVDNGHLTDSNLLGKLPPPPIPIVIPNLSRAGPGPRAKGEETAPPRTDVRLVAAV